MGRKIHIAKEGVLCGDCVVATGAGDLSGINEDSYDAVVDGMEWLGRKGNLTLSYSGDEEDIDSFSTEPCMCCGTKLAGYREAAYICAPKPETLKESIIEYIKMADNPADAMINIQASLLSLGRFNGTTYDFVDCKKYGMPDTIETLQVVRGVFNEISHDLEGNGISELDANPLGFNSDAHSWVYTMNIIKKDIQSTRSQFFREYGRTFDETDLASHLKESILELSEVLLKRPSSGLTDETVSNILELIDESFVDSPENKASDLTM